MKEFGRFEAKSFHTYRVNVRFTRNLPVLNQTDPEAIIQVDPIHASDASVGSTIYFLLVVLLALVGTILWLPHLYWSRKQRRVLANQNLQRVSSDH